MCRQRIRMGVPFLMKNWVIRPLATSWEHTVAQAAPSMPQWNFMMNSQSRTILETAPAISRNMAVFGWPMERMKWFMPGAIVWNTAPHKIMRM